MRHNHLSFSALLTLIALCASLISTPGLSHTTLAAAQVVIKNEDFESGFPTTGWNDSHNGSFNGLDITWGTTDYQPGPGNHLMAASMVSTSPGALRIISLALATIPRGLLLVVRIAAILFIRTTRMASPRR